MLGTYGPIAHRLSPVQYTSQHEDIMCITGPVTIPTAEPSMLGAS